jgi:hypothetical protein
MLPDVPVEYKKNRPCIHMSLLLSNKRLLWHHIIHTVVNEQVLLDLLNDPKMKRHVIPMLSPLWTMPDNLRLTPVRISAARNHWKIVHVLICRFASHTNNQC